MKTIKQFFSTETNMSKTLTILASGHKFEGTMTCAGASQVDGEVIGKIFTQEDLVLGPAATVDGDIDCQKKLTIYGSFSGNIISEKVELMKSAQVTGKITTNKLVVEEGSQFNGNIAMPKAGAGLTASINEPEKKTFFNFVKEPLPPEMHN
jgi:cytoskeletal protein CcmA (bactofilin family)